MSKKLYSVIASLVLVAVVLTACAPAAATSNPSTPQMVEVTRIVEGTPKVVEITSTPAPTVAQAVVPTLLPAGSVQINGAGATFPLPVYTEWTYAYQYVDPSVALNYQGIGSGGGKKGIVDGTIDFAGSDSLLKDEEYTAGKDLQMYPILAGAVVPIYNIKWNLPVGAAAPTSALILDRKTLVGIYNGTTTMWNDPAILALNPDLKDVLPAAKITAVHRSDGSGTTEIFTKSLASFSPDWKAGGGSSVEWPVDKVGNGIGGKGNPGVAGAVLNTPNSIGYVELSFAVANNIPNATVVNKAGKPVKANADSLASAMNDFASSFSDKLTNTIVDAPGDGSWPIAGYTYLILHTTNMSDCVKAQKLLEYIRWSLTDAAAADKASKLGYSVLPADVQKMVLDKLAAVTCNGSPVLK
jgi:phosphate transport system substrate-binding protein